ncbi:hypothetical protein C8R45DRAFT_1113221 [Mycena sanguinolenta]|nr:hypothetical protein C8R45DRAFT_1113221 [Mycena sanguinolenta]
MSGLPTRHSRRLYGEAPSPLPPSPPPRPRGRRDRSPLTESYPADPPLNDRDSEGSSTYATFVALNLHTSFRFDPESQNSVRTNATPTDYANIPFHQDFHIQTDQGPVQQMSDADALFLHDMWNSSDPSFENYQTNSSPYPLVHMSDGEAIWDSLHHFSEESPPLSWNPSEIMHSPRPVEPVSRTASMSGNSFALVPAFPSSNFPSPASEVQSSPPVPEPLHTAPTPPGIQIAMPARGSLAYLRMHHTVTPGRNFAAIYLAFPLHDHPARRAFFEPALVLASRTPSVADLVRALRNHGGAAGQMLDSVCSTLATTDFCIAWSRHMVEVHDSYSAISHGCREVGLLREHLHASQVIVQCANHNDASRATFTLHDVAPESPLFVLYIYPAQVPATAAGIEPLPQAIVHVAAARSQSHTPAYTRSSQSRTPAPASISTPSFTFVLASVLRTSLALDRHFLEDGFQLASFLDRDYGTAFLQIRQALIIESVLRRSTPLISQLKVHDVAAWAGMSPATYSNNRTFAKEARATLLLLRSRGLTQVSAQSADI